MTTERNPQAHTPGPWRTSTAVVDGFNPVMGPGGVIIALVSTLAGNRMDARLIASAPELLAALQELAPELRIMAEWTHGPTSEEYRAKYERARAAIASATLGGEGA